MSAGKRLAVCMAVAAIAVAGVLVGSWWRLGETTTAPATNVEESGGNAQLDRLRERIEREMQQLREARRQQDRTEAELRALEQSLDDAQERIERLQRNLETGSAENG